VVHRGDRHIDLTALQEADSGGAVDRHELKFCAEFLGECPSEVEVESDPVAVLVDEADRWVVVANAYPDNAGLGDAVENASLGEFDLLVILHGFIIVFHGFVRLFCNLGSGVGTNVSVVAACSGDHRHCK